jgi:type I restriction enzyme R subunit
VTPPVQEEHVEQAAIDLFLSLGWTAANVMDETFGERGTLGREHKGEVVLMQRLRAALVKLNLGLPASGVDQAIEALTRDRSALTLVAANREIYGLVQNGVKVRVPGANDEDGDEDRTVRVIDWDQPEKNDFFVAQQLWVQGQIYQRRADLVGFVNGLPLVFIELKGIDHNVEEGFRNNFRDYLDTIPQLFWFNAAVIFSNGLESRLGTITGQWANFKEWKRIEREEEKPTVSLETILRGVCDRHRLFDLVENFTLFSDGKSATRKIISQNHQFLGVNNAIRAVEKYKLLSSAPATSAKELTVRRALGVFWHTQGSGKSFSMVFLSQKILRKIRGNWTFVIITDRTDLDDQIYKTFAACKAVTEEPERVRAQDCGHLKQLLREDHRYVFTLIQKFRTPVKGAKYEVLSERSDIIVIADEAHRSQYDTFALNMRSALPNAAFIGFTGTPLLAGEEKTREVFGDYISIYNFRQAIEDNATVPLYYEARIPELQLANEDFNDDLAQVLEDAELDEDQQKAVERQFARQYHLITREERLDTIAADLVQHFLGLPRGTKAMTVAIDKVTAVRMYDKVKAAWAIERTALSKRISASAKNAADYGDMVERLAYMDATDMAVVVSSGQNEVDEFRKKKLQILPHRLRMKDEDLATSFKDEKNRLRIVFVCAMWMTGFDVECCGAIYLDKPMRNHTLMQTIARANRVFEGKANGLIVDYVGVFRNLQKALAIYGTDSRGEKREGDSPVQPKQVQIDDLRLAIDEAKKCAEERGVDVAGIAPLGGLARLAALRDAIDKLVHPENIKRQFVLLAVQADRLYRAVGTDARKADLSPDWGALTDIARGLRGLEQPVDISQVMSAVDRLLDESVAAKAFVMRDSPEQGEPSRIDLGKIDFDALKRFFDKSKHKAASAEALIVATRDRVARLVHLNPTRVSLRERFEEMIAEYNAGRLNVADFFRELLAFMKKVEAEEARASTEGLTVEQLPVYDLLRAKGGKPSAKDSKLLKTIAKKLPKQIAPKLVIDWRKGQKSRAAVRVAIRDALDDLPELLFDEAAFDKVVEEVFEHVYESYFGEGKSKYAET